MSHRGSNTLFNDIFNEPVLKPVNSPTLRDKKIDCIIDFYYYTGRKTSYKYPQLLQECSEVFFLTSITLHDIMQANLDKLISLKQQWKDEKLDRLEKHLAKKWPYLVW